jgi:hypothetical protein
MLRAVILRCDTRLFLVRALPVQIVNRSFHFIAENGTFPSNIAVLGVGMQFAHANEPKHRPITTQ